MQKASITEAFLFVLFLKEVAYWDKKDCFPQKKIESLLRDPIDKEWLQKVE